MKLDLYVFVYANALQIRIMYAHLAVTKLNGVGL